MSRFSRWPPPLSVMPPLPLIQFWQYRNPSLAIWPVADWLPVRETIVPTVIAVPVGGATKAGLGEHPAARELTAIRAARASQDLRTSRDYLPREAPGRTDRLTSLLIAGRTRAGWPTKLCDWLRWRVSQVVRQRSAKPPPRVRIPHSPPIFEYDLMAAAPRISLVTATVTATPLNSGDL